MILTGVAFAYCAPEKPVTLALTVKEISLQANVALTVPLLVKPVFVVEHEVCEATTFPEPELRPEMVAESSAEAV